MTLIEARRSLLSSRSYLGYMAYVMTSMSAKFPLRISIPSCDSRTQQRAGLRKLPKKPSNPAAI